MRRASRRVLTTLGEPSGSLAHSVVMTPTGVPMRMVLRPAWSAELSGPRQAATQLPASWLAAAIATADVMPMAGCRLSIDTMRTAMS